MNKSLQRGFILLTVILLAIVALMVALGLREPAAETVHESLQAREDSLVAQYERRQAERQREYEARKEQRRREYRSSPRRQEAFYEAVTVAPRDTVVRQNRYQPRPALVFDLNEADTTDLQQLRGIGPVIASRIVRHRESLGGFVSLEQLMEVKYMTDSLFNQIVPHLRLDNHEVKKLNINTATLDELKHHGYLGYYKARAIVQYRERMGAFRQPQDLLKVSQIDEETYNKILPYIEL